MGGEAPVPGERTRRPDLDDLVATMDRLYSPGGCPWDARQTHHSLAPYLLEEAHELAEALESDDRPGIREELGDVLFQVVFHARIAQDDPVAPFGLPEVVADLVGKLWERHPHVFGPDGSDRRSTEVLDDAALEAQWEEVKRRSQRRASVLEGIALGQGALARAQKVCSRAGRAGVLEPVTDPEDAGDPARRLGAELYHLVVRAQREGVDAEAALRAHLRSVEAGIRRREDALRPADPAGPDAAPPVGADPQRGGSEG